MPSLVMSTRLIRPFTIIFSRSLGIKNIWPKVPYLLHASAKQWHTIYTPSSFLSLLLAILLLCESEFKHVGCKGCVACKQLHSHFKPLLEALLFYLIEVHSLGLVWRQATTFTGFPPVQVLLSHMTRDDLFTHNKGDANSLVRRDAISPSLANLSASSFPSILWCPGIHTKVTLSDTLSFF